MDLDKILLTIVTMIVILVALAIYITIVRQHIAITATALDKDYLVQRAQGVWARLDARLLGWKTVILAAIAGAAQGVPPLLNELLPSVAGMPWVEVVDHKVAAWISIVCTVLIPIVHAKGMATAATTVPVEDRPD